MKRKLAILVNAIAPTRIPTFSTLAKRFDTLVLHGGTEPNRSWVVDAPPDLKTRRVFTIQTAVPRKSGVPGVPDVTYLHLNLGIISSLVRFRPDIIVTNEFGLRTLIAIAYGKLARAPVWVWWGGTLHTERFTSRLKKFVRGVIVRSSKHWISYGVTSTEYLESIGVPRSQILQIQNCVPQDAFLVEPPQPLPWLQDSKRPVILSVGQLIQRKGLDKLIEACGRLKKRGYSFSLVIVGGGPERDRLLELAKANELDDFQILPDKSQSVLNEIYRSANVFVFPTLEDVWGLVVNEALWAGLPVLCSKYAGCAPELVEQENIFDPLSPDDFDAALTKIFNGNVLPADRSKLRTWQEVSDAIAMSLEEGRPVWPVSGARATQ